MSLLEPAAALAIRCSECGSLNMVKDSLFVLQGHPREVTCTCGQPLLRYRGSGRTVRLEVLCFLCEKWHPITRTVAAFLKKRVEELCCPESGFEMALMGSDNMVQEKVDHGSLGGLSLTADVDLEEYFQHPDNMFTILDHLYVLSKDSQISCSCGNDQVEFNLFAQRIELCCFVCGSILPLPAVTAEDVDFAFSLTQVTMDSNLYAPVQFGKGRVSRERPTW